MSMSPIPGRPVPHRTSSLNARPAGASAATTSPRGLYKQTSAPSHFTANDPSRRVMFDSSAGATKGNVNGSGKSTSGSGMGGGGERREGSLPPLPSYAAVQPGAVLSALGPGSVFGEGVAFTAFEEGHGGGSRRSRPMRVMLRASADGAGEAHSIGGPSHGGAGNSSMAPVRMRAARASDPSSSLPRPTQPQAVTNISSSMAAYPGVYQCGVIARKATKLLALSACDVARLGSEVIGRLKVLSDARSLLMAQRSDSIKVRRCSAHMQGGLCLQLIHMYVSSTLRPLYMCVSGSFAQA